MKKILQKIADFIVNRGYKAQTKTDAGIWLEIGMSLDNWCVKRNIYLS